MIFVESRWRTTLPFLLTGAITFRTAKPFIRWRGIGYVSQQEVDPVQVSVVQGDLLDV